MIESLKLALSMFYSKVDVGNDYIKPGTFELLGYDLVGWLAPFINYVVMNGYLLENQ